jgi:hypothetical protein
VEPYKELERTGRHRGSKLNTSPSIAPAINPIKNTHNTSKKAKKASLIDTTVSTKKTSKINVVSKEKSMSTTENLSHTATYNSDRIASSGAAIVILTTAVSYEVDSQIEQLIRRLNEPSSTSISNSIKVVADTINNTNANVQKNLVELIIIKPIEKVANKSRIMIKIKQLNHY